MNRPLLTRTIFLAVCLLSAGRLSAGAEPCPATNSWKRLTYEAAGWIGSSNIQIELRETLPGELQAATPELLEKVPLQRKPRHILVMDIQARADSMMNRHRSTVQIWFDADSGAVLQREKIRTGKKPYRKVYRFSGNGASRLKQEPASREEAGNPVRDWDLTRQSVYPYDLKSSDCDSVTDPAVLLYLLSSGDEGAPHPPAPRCVFFDDALYRVSFSVTDGGRLPVTYRSDMHENGTGNAPGTRPVQRYELDIVPLTPDANRDDFELFELRGNIVIMMDSQSRVPVQLAGDRPGVGRITVPLVELQ